MKLKRKLGLTCALALGTVAAAATIGFTTVSCSDDTSSSNDNGGNGIPGAQTVVDYNLYQPSEQIAALFTKENFGTMQSYLNWYNNEAILYPMSQDPGVSNLKASYIAELKGNDLIINQKISFTMTENNQPPMNSFDITTTFSLVKGTSGEGKDKYKMYHSGTENNKPIDTNSPSYRTQYFTKQELTNVISLGYYPGTLTGVKIFVDASNIPDGSHTLTVKEGTTVRLSLMPEPGDLLVVRPEWTINQKPLKDVIPEAKTDRHGVSISFPAKKEYNGWTIGATGSYYGDVTKSTSITLIVE